MYQYQIDKRKINELLREENVAIRERNKRFQIDLQMYPARAGEGWQGCDEKVLKLFCGDGCTTVYQ